MDPISSGGNTEKTQPTIGEISQRLDKIDVSNAEKLSNELAGLSEDMNAEIRAAFDNDGKIDKDESSRLYLIETNLCRLSWRIKSAMQNATDEVKNTYEQLVSNLKNLINKVSDASNGKDPDQVALEPGETDADMAAADEPVKVPRRMYWKANQSDIESVYEAIANPQGKKAAFYNRPQVKIGGLLGFIGEYSTRLDKEQIAFIRNYIQTLNSISASQEKESSQSQGFDISASFLPDAKKVKAYWNAIKSAGVSHDLKSELMVLGYSEKDANKLASEV